MSDELDEAMRRVQQGERAAFDAVFALAWPRAQAWCARALKHPQDAEDAAQSALEKIFEQAVHYDPARSALAWILAVASWEVRTIQRRRMRHKDREGALEPVGEALTDDGADPETALIEANLVAAAEEVLRGLPEADRCLVMDAIHGRPSAAPGVSPAAIRKRRQRAMARLRDAWRVLHGH